MVSLRPQGQQTVLRTQARQAGLAFVALPPWRLCRSSIAEAQAALATAVQADVVVFTSPAAVVAAASLGRVLAQAPPRPWLAVGDGTRLALEQAGFPQVQAPSRMDSEGLLALEVLQAVEGQRIGLVTAPGGRGLLTAQLEQRGALMCRADVYQRHPLQLPARGLARLDRSPSPWYLLVSSAEALQRTWSMLDLRQQQRWQAQVHVVAASARLLAQAEALGLTRGVLAAGPGPDALMSAVHTVSAQRRTD